ncbi:MAG: toprim domain-containing protein [Candidatus Rokuibacteriota bacterium]
MDKPWMPILRRLTHRDVWGPGGIAPLEAFRRSGPGYVARCPHHRPDTHPSFTMKEGRFDGYCFACRYRVSWIDCVAQRLGVTDRRAAFWKAIEVLAARVGMPVPRRRLEPNAPDAFETAARWLRAQLLENTAVAKRCRDYLVQRELIADVLELLPVGCLTDPAQVHPALRAAGCLARDIAATGLTHRYLARAPLVFVCSDGERVTGFKGRVPDRAQKRILNAKGFGGEREQRSLYCADLAREAIKTTRQAVLVEGEFDCLVWWSWALSRGQAINWVALGGTSKPSPMTFKRLRALGADTVLLALDDDQSGHLATAAGVCLAWQVGLEPVVVQMPTGCKDPDEVFRNLGPRSGLEAMRSSVQSSPEWLVRHWADLYPPDGADGAAQILAEARRTAACAPPIALATIIRGVAHALGLETAVVRADLLRAAEEASRTLALLHFQQWAREIQTLRPQDLPDALGRGHAMLEALQGGRTP